MASPTWVCQQVRLLSGRKPQEKFAPELTKVNSPDGGWDRLSPLPLRPQHSTIRSVRMPQAWNSPALTETN